MLTKIFILLALATAAHQLHMPCLNVWEKEYLIFVMRQENGMTQIGGDGITSLVNGGSFTFSCSEVDIPASCRISGKAKVIFATDGGEDCLVLRDDIKIQYPQTPTPFGAEGEYTVYLTLSGNAVTSKEPSALGELTTVNVEVRHDPLSQNTFRKFSGGFEVSIFLSINPVVKLTFLQILKEHPLMSTLIFFALGFLLCFFGLKFYRDMLMFFIPLMIGVLGFYLYLTIVEKSVEYNSKFILIVVTLLCIGAVIALAIYFTNVIYFVLCELTSRPRLLPTRGHRPQAPRALLPLLHPAQH